MTNALVNPPANGQLPADPAELQKYYEQYAEAYAQEERRASQTISARNGVLSVGDNPIPGNTFAAVILDAVRMNTFYTESFDAKNITPPRCYALGRNDAEMAPHPDMAKDQNFFSPQAERCLACPHNEFGSAQNGKGKACSNRRRLILLVAGTYSPSPTGLVLDAKMDADYYAKTPTLNMALAPTSLGGWSQFVRDTAANYKRPPMGVIARVYLYAHPQHGKEAIGFETLGPTPDEWGPTIFQRHQQAAVDIMEGFEPPEPTAQKGGGFYQAQAQAIR